MVKAPSTVIGWVRDSSGCFREVVLGEMRPFNEIPRRMKFKQEDDLDAANRGMNLWLDPIPSCLRADAIADFEAGDAVGFLSKAGNHDGLDLVSMNLHLLKARGIYEAALLHAFTSTRLNNIRCSMAGLKFLFTTADRQRLLAAGHPLPGPGPFTIYRGVAGRALDRRVRGFSWTASSEQAAWFARRSAKFGLVDPAVYEATVDHSAVLAYSNDRKEQEFIVMLPPTVRTRRIEVAS